MKTLFLMRHAKAAMPESGQKDFDRPLAARGKTDAPIMGKRLKKRAVIPDLIISSPAPRALRTAKDVAKELGYPEKKIEQNMDLYEAEIEDVLRVIRGVDDQHSRLMIFGHNPAFTSLVGFLGDQFIENLPTSGVAQIDFELGTWKQVSQQSGKVSWLDSPKKEG